MDAVKDGHRSALSSGRMVALAAGLSVGATVGYIVYRHVSGAKSGERRREGDRSFKKKVGDERRSVQVGDPTPRCRR